jgi:hypothetical protein
VARRPPNGHRLWQQAVGEWTRSDVQGASPLTRVQRHARALREGWPGRAVAPDSNWTPTMEGRDMGNEGLIHYPAKKRRWRVERCACGLRLRNCPDWRGFLADLRDVGRLGRRLESRP